MHRETNTLALNRTMVANTSFSVPLPDTQGVTRIVIHIEALNMPSTGHVSYEVEEVSVTDNLTGTTFATLSTASPKANIVIDPLMTETYQFTVWPDGNVGSSSVVTISAMYEYADA